MRGLYRKLFSYESRYRIYKLLHSRDFRLLRSRVNPDPKGDYSLRGFDERESIFVHVPKCAGTSVAKSLFGYLPYHYTAIEYRVIFGRRDFSRYFKFAFARNPWDRLYSAYQYLKGGGWNDADREWAEQHLRKIKTFEGFVLDWLSDDRRLSHIHFRPQRDFLCDSTGKVMVDYLGHFETLEQDFAQISKRVNTAAHLVHTNRSVRKGYREAYTPQSIEKIRSLYEEDIGLLGYEFEGLKGRVR